MFFRLRPISQIPKIGARSLRKNINTKRTFVSKVNAASKKNGITSAFLLSTVAAALTLKLVTSPLDNGPKVDPSKPAISPDEVAKHNNPNDCWVVIDGYVYDLTEFAPAHPGGPSVIKSNAGKDVSAIFDPLHPPDAIEKYIDPSKRLGPLKDPMPEELVCSPFTPGETADEVAKKLQLRARLPPLDTITNLYDFEFLASQILTKQAWAYYSSGSDDEITMRENHSAYHRIFFKPRILVDVSNIDTKTEMLGETVDVPFYASATALCKLGNPSEGEKDVTRGCGSGKKRVPQMISTMASCSLDEIVGASNDDQLQWFQLYINENRDTMGQMISNAEKLGCKALFVTVDAPGFGNREKDAKIKLSSSSNGPKAMESSSQKDDQEKSASTSQSMSKFIDSSFTWDDLPQIKERTKLPIIIKGIQRVEDVIKAAEAGVQGVVISNHGGRQLDFSRSPIEVLAEAQPILKERNYPGFEVFIDGGVRRGTDVIKALCLGAKGVGLGRPFLYANSTYGKEGVQRAVEILNAEMVTSMKLLGVNSIKELGPDLLDTSALKSRGVQVPKDYLFDKSYVSSNFTNFLPPPEGEGTDDE